MPAALLSELRGRPEVVILILMSCVIAMLVIPLPTYLVDFLIGVNIAISVLLFLGAFHIERILNFSSFPSMLLITTLFRLALSISTTRLILIDADAGKIIDSFGRFVIGDSLAVGFVVFAIVTIVQFIVIAKGSERVAEVAARFSLDGMPGKQMSIDADVKAGKVTLSADADVLSFVEAELGLSVAASRSEIYGSLVDYVTSASHKFTTWIRHSPIALIAKIRDLFTISSSYESDRARADFSSDCLEDDLIALCGKSLDIARYGLAKQPVERQHTYMGEVHAGVSANIGVSASLSAAGRKFVTIKQARLDILALAESKPDVARRLLSGSTLVCTPEKLLEVMRAHLKQSSREITSELMTGRHGSGIEDMEARAQYLLEQFALLKLSGDLAPEVEAIFMELFKERERILRPHSLAVYELNSRQSKWQAELNVGVGLGALLPDGIHGNVTYEKVTEDEDPYYCGSFTRMTLAGSNAPSKLRNAV